MHRCVWGIDLNKWFVSNPFWSCPLLWWMRRETGSFTLITCKLIEQALVSLQNAFNHSFRQQSTALCCFSLAIPGINQGSRFQLALIFLKYWYSLQCHKMNQPRKISIALGPLFQRTIIIWLSQNKWQSLQVLRITKIKHVPKNKPNCSCYSNFRVLPFSLAHLNSAMFFVHHQSIEKFQREILAEKDDLLTIVLEYIKRWDR